MAKKSALGRGLGALIDTQKYEERQHIGQANASGGVNEIEISKIEANPFQPRKEFEEEALKELSESIKEIGVIQPITLRQVSKDKYQLIAGERRLKASKLAGKKTIPAFVREAEDESMLELALVENIHREDLNPIEIAISYHRLLEECKLTQETLAEKIKKKRTTVTNYLRLLKLPPEIQIGVRDKKISMGHAKALITVDEKEKRIKLFLKIVSEGLSVRKTEELARQLAKPTATRKKKIVEIPEHYTNFAHRLRNKLETNIEVKREVKGNGKLVIPFKSDEDFNRIMDILDKLA